jgi:hypothetical protein
VGYSHSAAALLLMPRVRVPQSQDGSVKRRVLEQVTEQSFWKDSFDVGMLSIIRSIRQWPSIDHTIARLKQLDVTLVTVETLIPVIGDTHRAHTFAEHYAQYEFLLTNSVSLCDSSRYEDQTHSNEPVSEWAATDTSIWQRATAVPTNNVPDAALEALAELQAKMGEISPAVPATLKALEEVQKQMAELTKQHAKFADEVRKERRAKSVVSVAPRHGSVTSVTNGHNSNGHAASSIASVVHGEELRAPNIATTDKARIIKRCTGRKRTSGTRSSMQVSSASSNGHISPTNSATALQVRTEGASTSEPSDFL